MATIPLPTTASIDQRAFGKYAERGAKPGLDLQDWLRAEDEEWRLAWRMWLRIVELRPYLSLEVEENPDELARTLQHSYPLDGKPKEAVGLLALLDGSPEFSLSRFREWAKDRRGPPPEECVENKDTAFYRLCRQTLAFHKAVFNDQRPGEVDPQRLEDRRRYQDACVVAFPGANGAWKAFAAALHLHRVLATDNESGSRPWPDRLHARFAIGTCWTAAVRSAALAWRGEILVEPSLFGAFDRPQMELLLAAGARIGPATQGPKP